LKLSYECLTATTATDGKSGTAKKTGTSYLKIGHLILNDVADSDDSVLELSFHQNCTKNLDSTSLSICF